MRERSWSKHSLALKAQLNDATFNFESALLFLQIDILTRAPQTVIGIKQTDLCKHENGIMCPTSSIPEQEKNATSFLLANSQEKLRKFFVESEYLIDEIPKILTARYYFDRSGPSIGLSCFLVHWFSGLMLLGIFLSLKLLEIKYGHGDVYDPIKCVVDADSNRYEFVAVVCAFHLIFGGRQRISRICKALDPDHHNVPLLVPSCWRHRSMVQLASSHSHVRSVWLEVCADVHVVDAPLCGSGEYCNND